MNPKDLRTIQIAACIEQSRGMIPSNEKRAVIAKLEADARALWAMKVLTLHAKRQAQALHIPGDRIPDLMLIPVEDTTRIAAAEAFVAGDPSLDPDAPRFDDRYGREDYEAHQKVLAALHDKEGLK